MTVDSGATTAQDIIWFSVILPRFGKGNVDVEHDVIDDIIRGDNIGVLEYIHMDFGSYNN